MPTSSNTGNTIKKGKSFTFWGLDECYKAVTVVGLGKKCVEPDELEIISEEKEAVRAAAAAGIKNITVESFGDAESAAEGGILSSWKYQGLKSKKDDLPTVDWFEPSEADLCGFQRGSIKGEAQNLARRLADTPSNLLTPSIFADEAASILTPLGVDVKVYDKKWAEDQKMFSFLSVARGSIEPPKFLEITYKNSDSKPYVLVGKGVTFDAGGISLKPAANMDHMRADMGGAAAVFGAIQGIARLGVQANIKVLIPLVENMPSGSATKPGDVVMARNGKSICVDNTDAEGRLILADALCYSAEFCPEWVLDIATLTGAMVVCLGNAATGVFTNSNKLYQVLEKAGSETGDRVWRFPLWKHYTKQISENNAYDLNNIGKGKGGGSCTAAAFLKEFVPEKTNWLHLDIASVMGPDHSVPYLSKGMTGRPTRTLIEFVESQVNNK
ncbi:cytosol aminopeptidase-like [Aethina tumida]|uniref:cytosol aminopeptidase-like n=1 Tax=Aethina tumida TaxID=116153 RepID=UPI00096B530E|nr:cytosol aminopeptidase-like [Aethina tumida]